MNIKIIYEDDDLFVIDKPAGLTVNRSETTKNQITIQDWIEKEFRIQNSEFRIDQDSDFYKRAGIVHRLDKETSGLLIIAKNKEAFLDLQKQFKERSVKKKYIALAHGKIIPQEGKIKAPVGRLPWNRTKFGILAGGRESVTDYKAISSIKYPESKTNKELTLVELYPQTGRTHQIRVHLKYINHPVFSDFLYAGRKTSREDRKLFKRVFLHASEISFTQPLTGKKISLKSPLPQDAVEFLNTLKN